MGALTAYTYDMRDLSVFPCCRLFMVIFRIHGTDIVQVIVSLYVLS